jgi:hypothetical protein
MPRSEARVVTDHPHRHAKQLASHLGHRSQTSWDEEAGEGRIVFQGGTGTLAATEGALLLSVEADAERLGLFEDVVGGHLVRFGTKDELVRDSGEPGTVQRNAEEPGAIRHDAGKSE